MYHRYSEGKDFEHSRQEDRDAQYEFMRQRDHLERTVDSFKKLYYKETTKENTGDKFMKVLTVFLRLHKVSLSFESMETTYTV